MKWELKREKTIQVVFVFENQKQNTKRRKKGLGLEPKGFTVSKEN